MTFIEKVWICAVLGAAIPIFEANSNPAEPDATQLGDRQHDQRQQTNRDRRAAEDDRVAGGLHRPLHRRFIVESA